MNNIKRMVYLSLLVAVGLVLSFIESYLPALIMFPGAKLGLSNVVILTTIVCFGLKDSILIALLKSLILVLLTGNLISFFYSLPAGIFSCLIMNFSYRNFNQNVKIFSLVGVSIIGAMAHNFMQLTVASLMLSNINIYTYMPIMSLLSILTGCFVGLVSIFVSKKLKTTLFVKEDR